jgi:hypothetical protein
VLFHRPSRTLILADLVLNIGRPTHWWTRLYSRFAGFYDRVALSRVIRLTSFPDRVAAQRSVDQLLSLPIDRVVVGHGAPLLVEARAQLERACAWLPASVRHEPLASAPETCG